MHDHDVMNQSDRECVEQWRRQPAVPLEAQIHYSDLPRSSPESPIAVEWNRYCEDVGRLLDEGHEGRWVLIKGDQIIGIWDKEDEADRARLQGFGMESVLLKQICVWEPILRGGGYDRTWRS